jgi:hypothetical protein
MTVKRKMEKDPCEKCKNRALLDGNRWTEKFGADCSYFKTCSI